MDGKNEPEPWPFRPSDDAAWPEVPKDTSDAAEALYNAKLEVRKKRTDEEIAKAAADVAADVAVEQAFFQGLLDVAKGSVDRARASADFVQKAAAAIATIYTAILGVSFSVENRPFPSRGIPAAIFLGVAIVCSTYFLAWLDPQEQRREDEIRDDSPPRTPVLWRRIRFYVRWNRHAARDRAKWLRASVVALAASIALLPAAFVPLGHVPAPAAISWPPAAAAAPSQPIQLRSILYQAQINEASSTTATAAVGRFDWIWWVIAAVLGVLTWALAQFPLARHEGKQQQRRTETATRG